jgi:predicted alternative tryptophan synthase beta-subunit
VDDAKRFAGELARAKKPEPLPQAVVRSAEPHRPENMFERLSGVDPEELFATVKLRIAELRESLADQSVEPEVVFARWIRLLKEINVRHGQGAMPTPLFFRLNTELLDLLPVPPVARETAEPLTVS